MSFLFSDFCGIFKGKVLGNLGSKCPCGVTQPSETWQTARNSIITVFHHCSSLPAGSSKTGPQWAVLNQKYHVSSTADVQYSSPPGSLVDLDLARGRKTSQRCGLYLRVDLYDGAVCQHALLSAVGKQVLDCLVWEGDFLTAVWEMLFWSRNETKCNVPYSAIMTMQQSFFCFLT